MVYILGTAVWWIILALVIPLAEWRKYYPTVLVAGLAGVVSDLLGVVSDQWMYFGPKVGGLSLWSVLGIAPAESALFIRLYPGKNKMGVKGVYLLVWVFLNTFFEWFFKTVGWIGYRRWNPVKAFIYYLLYFSLIWVQEYWYNGTGRIHT